MKILVTTNQRTGGYKEVKEIIFNYSSVEDIRRISKFFEHCANSIENNKVLFGHAHLQDFERHDNDRHPDIIVVANVDGTVDNP